MEKLDKLTLQILWILTGSVIGRNSCLKKKSIIKECSFDNNKEKSLEVSHIVIPEDFQEFSRVSLLFKSHGYGLNISKNHGMLKTLPLTEPRPLATVR